MKTKLTHVLSAFLLFAVVVNTANTQSTPPYKNPNLPIEQRVDDLLLRGYAGQPTVHGATLLFAALAVLGFGLLARRRSGLTLLAGLFGGTLLVEFVLPLADRFSHFRYDQFGLPFVFVAMAFAIVAFSRQLARWNRLSGVATGRLAPVARDALLAVRRGIVAYSGVA